jgi:WD40 repeat protein
MRTREGHGGAGAPARERLRFLVAGIVVGSSFTLLWLAVAGLAIWLVSSTAAHHADAGAPAPLAQAMEQAAEKAVAAAAPGDDVPAPAILPQTPDAENKPAQPTGPAVIDPPPAAAAPQVPGQPAARLTIAVGVNKGVTSLAFTPDGQTLLAASGGVVRRWKPATGEEEMPLLPRETRGSTVFLALSADGKVLATGDTDRTARIWDLTTKKVLAVCGGQGLSVPVAISPDGKTLVSGGEAVRLWDVAAGKSIATLAAQQVPVDAVAFAPDGKQVATGGTDKTVKVWDAATRGELFTLTGHTDAVTALAFSPDGKTLASASADRTVRLWDLATQQERLVLRGHADPLSSVAFSPDGKVLVSGAGAGRSAPGHAGEVFLWDTLTGQQLARLAGHTDDVSAVAIAPDGKSVASAGRDNTVRLWDVAEFTAPALAAGPGEPDPTPGADVPPSGVAAGAGRDKALLAQKVKEILTGHCYRCHGQDGAAEGGFNFALETQRLIGRQLVVPNHPARSRLLLRVLHDEMPPEEEKDRLSEEQVAVLKSWIAQGAPAFAPPGPRAPQLALEQVIQFIHDDLARLPEADRPTARYFTLTHLANAGLSEDELQTYRHALSKLVNSLSWNPQVVVPRAINPGRTIFRIDLRDYKWNAPLWETIVAAYPYHLVPKGEAAEYCRTATGSALPYVRGDWFVNAAARPPLYQQILQLPATLGELSGLLRPGHPDDHSRYPKPPGRAGFNDSGVARNNRVLERWDTKYGAMWQTFDFAGNTGKQNIFEYPIGFKSDGSEVLFNLPNGLQAYAIFDVDGNRKDRAPTSLVSDPKRPDRAMENGLSCMSCHVQGVIEKTDQVYRHVAKNPLAYPAQGERILAVYLPPQDFLALLRADARRFDLAVAKTGAPVYRTEAISALAVRFEADLDVTLAAAEVGLEPAEFVRRGRASPRLVRKLGPLLEPAGTIKRELFADLFPVLVRELQVPGVVLPERLAADELTPRSIGLRGAVLSVAFTPDGRGALTADQTGKVQLWDLKTGRTVHSYDVPGVRLAAVVADGSAFVTGSGQGLGVWDLKTGKSLRQFGAGEVQALALAPDGKSVLASDADGVRLWDLKSGKEVGRFKDDASGATCLAFAADGKLVLSARGRVVSVWDVDTGKPLRRLEGHTGRVLAVALSPDGKQALSSGDDKTLRLWDVTTGEEVRRVGGPTLASGPQAVAFLADGKHALTGMGKDLRLWDVTTGEEVRAIHFDERPHTRPVTALAISPDGGYALSGGVDERVNLWELFK